MLVGEAVLAETARLLDQAPDSPGALELAASIFRARNRQRHKLATNPDHAISIVLYGRLRRIAPDAPIPSETAGALSLFPLSYWSGLGNGWADEALDFYQAWTNDRDSAARDRAISLWYASYLTILPGDSWPARPSNLATALSSRYQAEGGQPQADIDDAVRFARTSVRWSDTRTPNRSVFLSALAIALARRFAALRRPEDIDEAVGVGTEAIGAADGRSPEPFTNLGLFLAARYQISVDRGDLDAGMTRSQQACALPGLSRAQRTTTLCNLGSVAQARFEQIGDVDDLVVAVNALAEAVTITEGRAAMPLMGLSNVLKARYWALGGADDLDQAIEYARSAVLMTDHRDGRRPGRCSGLGNAARLRFRLGRNRADLDLAVQAGQEAVRASALLPGSRRDLYLTNLGLTLLDRYELGAEDGDLTAAIEALSKALAIQEQRPDPIVGPEVLYNLARAKGHDFRRTGDPMDLDGSVMLSHRAVNALPQEHPDRATYLRECAERLLRLASVTRSNVPRHRAMVFLGQAVECRTAPVAGRIAAARRLGRLAAYDHDWQTAARAFDAAVSLLPRLAWRGLTAHDQTTALDRMAGLGSDAAAAWLKAGDPEAALQALEQGRGILHGQALELRADLRALHDREPQLGQRLEQIGLLLDGHDSHAETSSAADSDDVLMLGLQERGRRQHLAHEWDDLVARVRALPGFAHFLRPTPASELREAAAHGPVAVINVSRYSCDVIVITHEHMSSITLEVTEEQITERVEGLIEALSALHGSGSTTQSMVAARHTLTDTLTWTWQHIAAPVLEAIGLCSRLSSGLSSRLWWCPTGIATLLPLHAAGLHNSRNQPVPQTVHDRVVSSYTPTLAALRRARERQQAAASAPPLVVALPHTPEYADLPSALREADRLSCRFPHAELLTGSAANTAEVLNAIRTRPWIHLACHGIQDLTAPLNGRLVLYDGNITVAELTRERTQVTDLAFLTGCETIRSSSVLTDESLTLGHALQLAGCRHVVGTLWSAHDSLGPRMVDQMYAALATEPGRTLSVERTAEALHAAVNHLRQLFPTDPALWAQFIHLGP